MRRAVGGVRRNLMRVLDLVVGADGDAGIVGLGGIVDDEAHRVTDFDHAADIGNRAGKKAFLEHFDVHDGLVGFDRGDDVAALDRIAGLLFPGDDHAFGHGVRQLRHHDRRTGVVRDHFGLCLLGDHFVGGNRHVACGVGDVAERAANGDGGADVSQRAGQIAGLEHLDVHDGLVGLDRGDDIAALDFVAGLLFPGDKHALGHGVRELRHRNGVMLGHAWFLILCLSAKDAKRREEDLTDEFHFASFASFADKKVFTLFRTVSDTAFTTSS